MCLQELARKGIEQDLEKRDMRSQLKRKDEEIAHCIGAAEALEAQIEMLQQTNEFSRQTIDKLSRMCDDKEMTIQELREGVNQRDYSMEATQSEHKEVVSKLEAEKEDLMNVLDDFLKEVRGMEEGGERVKSLSQELGMQEKVEFSLENASKSHLMLGSTAPGTYYGSTQEVRNKAKEMEAARSLIFEFKNASVRAFTCRRRRWRGRRTSARRALS